MTRCFVAIPMPEAVQDRLMDAQEMLRLARPVDPETFHLTLAFLDDQPEDVLEAVHDGLSFLESPAPEIRIAGFGWFGRSATRSIHARVLADPMLERLQSKVARIAVSSGIRLKSRRFVPHVTLSREKLRGDRLAAFERASVEHGAFTAPPFVAQSFGLFASELRPDGAVYECLQAYPFSRGGYQSGTPET